MCSIRIIRVGNPAILFLSHIKTGEKFAGCLFSFFLRLSKLLLDSSSMRTEYPGGGKGEKSLDAKSVQCSILLEEDTNARYVHLRLIALYFSLHDSQYGADLLCRGSGYDMRRGPKWRNSRLVVGDFRRSKSSI